MRLNFCSILVSHLLGKGKKVLSSALKLANASQCSGNLFLHLGDRVCVRLQIATYVMYIS